MLQRKRGMRFWRAVVCVFALGWCEGFAAQTPVNFSGTWKMDASRSESAAQGVPIGNVTVAITQSPGEVVIETTQDTTVQKIRYLPAGSVIADGSNSVGTFRWEGSELVTDAAIHINNQAVTVTERRRLNAAGEMIVDVTLAVQHGYSAGPTSAVRSRTPPNTSTGTNVFVKAR